MHDIRQLDDIEACVDAIMGACGDHVVMATPLGLGKPNRLINAVYERVAADRRRRLTLHTALSLDVLDPASDLERRFAPLDCEGLRGDHGTSSASAMGWKRNSSRSRSSRPYVPRRPP